MEAERESTKIKLLEFFEREEQRTKKNVFEAVITDIRSRGLFVELKISQAFGLIPLSSMTDDFYQIAGDGTSVVGRRTKRILKLGQTVSVEIARVDRFRRMMDFRLVADVDRNAGNGNAKSPRFRVETGKSKNPSRRRRH